MVYVTGDCHGDFRRFSSKNFPEQKEMNREDFVIVCGDFGGIWADNKEERYWLKWLSERPFTLLFVDGNHENFDRLYSNEFEIVDFHGGKAHKITDHIYHLMRGYVFDLCGKKFFAFGGASSHDITDGILDRDSFNSPEEFKRTCRIWTKTKRLFRVNHESWWDRELPDQEEMDQGRACLLEQGNKVDFVISHCLPQSFVGEVPRVGNDPDVLTVYFDEILQSGLQFHRWYCGHYHVDRQLTEQFSILYRNMIRIL